MILFLTLFFYPVFSTGLTACKRRYRIAYIRFTQRRMMQIRSLSAPAFVPARNRLNAGLPRRLTSTSGSRRENGAFCSHSRRVANFALKKATINSSGRFPSGVLTWAGPQPDTEEEEGSALDFPEVRSAEAARLHEILRLNAFLKILPLAGVRPCSPQSQTRHLSGPQGSQTTYAETYAWRPRGA